VLKLEFVVTRFMSMMVELDESLYEDSSSNAPYEYRARRAPSGYVSKPRKAALERYQKAAIDLRMSAKAVFEKNSTPRAAATEFARLMNTALVSFPRSVALDERIVLDSFDSIRTSGDSRLERGKTAIVLALLSWMRKKPCEDLNLDVTYRDARHTSIEL